MYHTIKSYRINSVQYSVQFDTKNKKVICDIDPIISGFERDIILILTFYLKKLMLRQVSKLI